MVISNDESGARRRIGKAKAVVEYTLVFFEAFLSSAKVIEKSFDVAANTETSNKSTLAVGLNETRYPKKTVTNTCTTDDKLERAFVQGPNGRGTSKRYPQLL
jgi:hypothetical protein